MGSSHVVVKMTAFVTYRHDADIFLSPATPCVTVALVLSFLVLYVFLFVIEMRTEITNSNNMAQVVMEAKARVVKVICFHIM